MAARVVVEFIPAGFSLGAAGLNLYRPAFRLAQPVYQLLLQWGIVARLMPLRFRPRLVVFQSTDGSSQPRLVWGRRVIGYHDNRLNRWIIYTPYRLFVDERILSKYK
jgi:hypothetical protein